MGSVEKLEVPFAINSVLVIDDHPLYCDALVSALSKLFEIENIHSAHSLQEGLEIAVSRVSPDLVMLDLKLPDVEGLSGFFEIKEAVPEVPVLVISAESSDETIYALMESGAAGFVPKGADQAEIKEALQRVRDGLKHFPEGLRKKSAEAVRHNEARDDVHLRVSELTPQQSRIMRLICAGKPNKQIAYELNLAEATVKAHITALLRRLGVSNRTQAAVLVNGANSALLPDADARRFLS